MTREPTLQARVLGHPLVVLGMTIVTLMVLYVCIFDQTAVPFGLIAIVLMSRVMAASRTMIDYKRWRREWAAMDGRAPASRTPRNIAIFFAVAIPAYFTAVDAGFLAIDYRTPMGPAPLVLGLLAVVGAAFAIVRALSRRSRRRGRRPKPFPVTTCISRPLPVPTLEEAYRALPTHCHVAMGSLR